MYDFMEYNLLAFFKQTEWNQENSYSSLNSFCRHALDFRAPAIPFSVIICKNISPHLKSSYALNVANVHHLSFLASSVPVHKLEARRAHDDLLEAMRISWDSVDLKTQLVKDLQSKLDQEVKTDKQYLLCGRLFSDNHLEAIWAHRFNTNYLSYISAASNPYSKAASQIYAKLHYANARSSAELTFSSARSLLGIRNLNHLSLSPNVLLSGGGEFYFTLAEKSGGLSVGGRIRIRDGQDSKQLSDLSVIVNPIMGYVTSTFGTTTSNNLLLTARYDFNIYSFDSDLACGVIFSPNDRSQLIKARFGFQQGLAVSWEASDGPLMVAIGAETKFNKGPAATFGFELQYSRQ